MPSTIARPTAGFFTVQQTRRASELAKNGGQALPESSRFLTFDGCRNGKSSIMRWDARQSAIIICDMWDDHWCKSAARRCAELAPRIDRYAGAARERGCLVVHAPSETMERYAGTIPRERARRAKTTTPPVQIKARGRDPTREPSLPIDDSDGGCDDNPPCRRMKSVPWTSQHSAITISEDDIVSDSGEEIYNVFAAYKIENVFIAGVHTNKCVLKRSFGIRQMVLLGFQVVLVRDLTDSLYNPSRPPRVGHDEATKLMVGHIERYWCPSADSRDIMGTIST